MAQKVQVILTDDLDGGDADETVQFAIDGVSYEIDLSEANAEALRKALGPHIIHGRRLGGRYAPRRAGITQAAAKAAGTRQRADLSKVRDWARENGFTPSVRGRLSHQVMAAYDAAH